MDQRYAMLAACGKRKITEFNAMVAAGTSKDKSGKVMRPLPYIVVIIDELADLMTTARNEVEEPIIRLAQLARAVGIHLVVATQRPSVDVITGLIKANFPARIAYQVASKIDSRTILDSSGAEQLLGNGDMLFTHGGVKPMRLQNSFVSTEEVEAITGFISAQMGYSSPYMLPSVLAVEGVNKVLSGDRDPLFQDAASIVIKTQQASTSFLQRRLKVGYSRAARIVDELEYAGIVGPAEGSKPRVVLLDSEAELERIL
jgi:S-DNA-T family DNA segregation ATPase FtsK/SpoIIIE